MSGDLAIVGAGSWGTALAIALSSGFESIQLWARDSGRAAEMQTLRENRRYLPGFVLPPEVNVSSDLRTTLASADIVIAVIPSRHFRTVLGCHEGPGES